MNNKYSNCWEIMNCGMDKDKKNKDVSECPASKLNMGHSCWVVAGVLRDGIPFCPRIHEGQHCFECSVYKRYSRSSGNMKEFLEVEFPEECKSYNKMMSERHKNRKKNK
jgi:hypothetical protein